MAHFRRHVDRFKDQSWSTLWKTALVRLPRAVPIDALKITNPEGPQPFLLELPSREKGRTIPLYIFIPPVKRANIRTATAAAASYVFPVVMDYHGGGFYLGSALEQAPFCAKLCRELQAIVISVDYRMAPLDKFPAAIEDADDVTAAVLDSTSVYYQTLRDNITNFVRSQWDHESLSSSEDESKRQRKPVPQSPNISLDTTRVAFSGVSSGGNIALNMALSVPASLGLPDWPSPIPKDYSTQIPLLLLYPSLDLRQLPSQRFRHKNMPPVDEHKRLDIDDHLAATYVSREMAGHPRASPGLVDIKQGLHKNVKILLVLSGIDTLWEQSNIWVEKIKDAGRDEDLKTMRFEDRKHGWTTIPEIALSADERKTRLEVLDECVHFTRVAWNGQDPVLALFAVPEGTPANSQPLDTTDNLPKDPALAKLLDMGLSAQTASFALRKANGDVDGAIDWILQQAEPESKTS